MGGRQFRGYIRRARVSRSDLCSMFVTGWAVEFGMRRNRVKRVRGQLCKRCLCVYVCLCLISLTCFCGVEYQEATFRLANDKRLCFKPNFRSPTRHYYKGGGANNEFFVFHILISDQV